MLSPYVTQRSNRYWSEPTLFRPERFLSGNDNATQPEAYFPFGAGPRRCIGQRFALMEGVLVLATLAQQVRLLSLDTGDIAVRPVATLRPRDAVKMQPVRR